MFFYFYFFSFRPGAQHSHQLQGVHVAVDQLHFPRHRAEQGGGVPALRPLQGVSHGGGRAPQEPRQRHWPGHGAKQPRHLLDGMCLAYLYKI